MNEIATFNPMRMVAKRRHVLAGLMASTAGILVGNRVAFADTGVVVSASNYPAKAFSQKGQDAALQALYGTSTVTPGSVTLDAPDIAENGAVVPVSVSTSLSNVTSITLLALDNPSTIAASYQIPAGTTPAVSSRIKLAKTTDVVAIVQAGGKLYSASKNVKVTLGGCGG